MKEDHMLNGQLKPAYNIQIGVASGYIVNFMASQERTDVNTLISFLEDISKYRKYKNIVVDVGYKSLENYRYLNENSNILWIFMKQKIVAIVNLNHGVSIK